MSTRKPLISGNWKMNLNHFEALKLVQQLSYEVTKDDVEAVDISVHPPFTDLRTVQTALESDRIPFALGAQHCHSEASGAFTGEVSPGMLAKLGVAYVIAGHSERREVFGETDELVNAKVKAILANGGDGLRTSFARRIFRPSSRRLLVSGHRTRCAPRPTAPSWACWR